jgi:putative tributyrin esterase
MAGKAGNGSYPTLYLLHGMSDDHTIWQRRTSIERYVSDMGIAVVMPTVHLSWYTDMYLGQKYWTFISEELPKICRGFFHNMSSRSEDTFAAGLSMGGYGALKLGLGASDTFGAVASLSGAVDVAEICDREGRDETSMFYNIFGPVDAVRGSENDLFAQAEKLAASGKAKPPIYLWCGTEDGLLDHNVRMRDHLVKLGFDVTYEQSPGDHSWKHWDDKIQTVLNWLPIHQ